MDEDNDGAKLVELANDMLRQLHSVKRVKQLRDINASVFVTLFEGLCGEQLPDVIRRGGPSLQNDAHNCQSVIDALSLDVLNASLSHITGEDVARGDRAAISNLLQVFHGLLEYILEKIGSDISTDADEEKRLRDIDSEVAPSDLADDPDMLTSDLIDDILEKELGRGYPQVKRPDTSRNRTEIDTDNTEELIALGRDISHSRRSGGESTAELIRLGQTLATSRMPLGSAGGSRTGRTDRTGGRPGAVSWAACHDDARPSDTSSGNVADISDVPIVRVSPNVVSRGAGVKDWRADGMTSRVSALPSVGVNDWRAEVVTGGVSALPSAGVNDWRANGVTGGVSALPYAGVNDWSAEVITNGVSALPSTGVIGTDHVRVVRERSPTAHMSHASRSWLPPSQRHLVATENRVDSRVDVPASSVSGPSGCQTTGPREGRTDHTFTRLYNHYDPIPSVNGVRQSVDLPASLPANLTASRSEKDGRHHPATSVTLGGDDLKSSEVACDPVKESLGGTVPSLGGTVPPLGGTMPPPSPEPTQISQPTLNLPTAKSSTYKDLLARLSKGMNASRVLSGLSQQAPSGGNTTDDDLSEKFRTTLKSNGRGQSQPCHDLTGRHIGSTECDGIRSPKRKADKSRLRVSFLPRDQKSGQFHREYGHQGRKRGVGGASYGRTLAAAAAAAARKPRTFPEYLDKYYGPSVCPSVGPAGSDDESYFSDGVIDYGHDARARSRSGGVDEGLEWTMKRRRRRRAKTVKFDDVLDDAAAGVTGDVRRRLKQQDETCRLRTQLLDKVYRDELVSFEEEADEIQRKRTQAGKEKEAEFKKKVLLKQKPSRGKAGQKFGATASVLYSPKRGRPRGQVKARKRSASASPSLGRQKRSEGGGARVGSGGDILPWLMAEFPGVHLSSPTLHDLWRKSAHQVEQLSRAHREVRSKKSKSQVEIEEAERRQKTLMSIMKKELAHTQRMRDKKEWETERHSVSAALRDRRQQSARSQRYYEQYELQMRAKMLRKRTREEQIFKKLFRDGLDVQKERIREMRRYVKEQRQQRAERHHNEITSLENHYKDQFAVLTESLVTERQDMETRENAQTKILQQMKRQLRDKMECEVRDFQQQLCRDEDDTFYRQLDADRMRHTLQTTRYQAQI